MKKQGIVTLSVTIILLAVLLYLALFGVSFGLREIRPMATLIKEQKLGLDLTGGFYAVYQAVDPTIEDFEAKMDGAVLVYRNRLDAKGMTEALSLIHIEMCIRDRGRATIWDFALRWTILGAVIPL